MSTASTSTACGPSWKTTDEPHDKPFDEPSDKPFAEPHDKPFDEPGDKPFEGRSRRAADSSVSMSAKRFKAGRDGITVRMAAQERAGFKSVLAQFHKLLLSDAHPGLMRFQPPVHIHDANAEKEFWDMVGGELLRHRLEAIETVEAGLEGAVLDETAVEAWMQTLNSLRLYLADSMGIGEAMYEPPEATASDEEAGRYMLYEWLGAMLDQLVTVAAEALPPGEHE